MAILGSCGRSGESIHPAVLVGVDGADWKVIEELWSEDRLPHMRALAARGVRATLRTFASESPVIWTTVATGVRPETHGITDFVVATPAGDAPITSATRRVPAIWNMVSAMDRRVAVLGWWPSWPAEAVNGVVVSERALLDLEDTVYPAEWLPEFRRGVEAVRGHPESPDIDARDRMVAHWAMELADKGFDLMLIYFRSVDLTSHRYWKFFRPQRFSGVEATEVEKHHDRIPSAYEFVDRTVGAIVAAIPEANLFLISDHGFRALRREKIKIVLNFDRVLERLGYLEFSTDGVDLGRSLLFTYATAEFRSLKRVRFALAGREPGGAVRPEDRPEIRRRLEADLAGVRYASGEPAFQVRDARNSAEQEADFVVQVLKRSPSREIFWDGVPIEGAITGIHSVSGSHDGRTHGILLAAGPDIDPAAQPEGIRVHDITPTLLYVLGLPVAEDFAGQAWTALFRAEYRQRQPLKTISSWGTRESTEPRTSEADEQVLEELRALGYLD